MSEIGKQEFLKKIKDNERRSGIRMIIAILLSLMLGLLTLYFAVELSRSEAAALESEANSVKLKLDYEKSRNILISEIDSLTYILKKCQGEGSKYSSEINSEIRRSEKAGYLIYLHDKSSIGRGLSSRVRERLEKSGYNVAGIQKVSGEFPSAVKYFHESDRNIAQEIKSIMMNLIKDSKIDLEEIDLQPLLKYPAPKRHVEIWISL